MKAKKDMTAEEIAEACEDAAAILEGHWCRGSWRAWGEVGYTYCVEGALMAALGLDLDMATDSDSSSRQVLLNCPVYDAVTDTVNEVYADTWNLSDGELPTWNDQDGRTEQEVLDILHLTAKRVQGVEI